MKTTSRDELIFFLKQYRLRLKTRGAVTRIIFIQLRRNLESKITTGFRTRNINSIKRAIYDGCGIISPGFMWI